MAIIGDELVYRLSGGAANTNAVASVGGEMSTAAGGIIPKLGGVRAIFDDVSGDEGAAGDIEYRCIYVQNTNATLTWQAIKAWILAQSPSPSSAYAIGLDPVGVGGTATTIGDEDTAPAGVSFSSPADKASGIDVPNIPAGSFHAIWLRRTITAGAAARNGDGPDVMVEGDTGAA